MKANRILIGLLSAAILATGCTREFITQEYTVIEGLDMTLVDYTVRSDNWQYRSVEGGNDDEGYYEAVLDVPDITRDVVEQGIVMVYRRYDGDVWTPLPAMLTEKTFLDDGTPFYFTTFTDFEWQQGQVSIFVTTSDLYAGYVPGDMRFRVAVQR